MPSFGRARSGDAHPHYLIRNQVIGGPRELTVRWQCGVDAGGGDAEEVVQLRARIADELVDPIALPFPVTLGGD